MAYGIDYGMGRANVDASTGIRYGVIPTRALDADALESFEADYGDPTCPDCAVEVAEYDEETHAGFVDDNSHTCADYACESCDTVFSSDQVFGDSPVGHTYTEEGYEATIDADYVDAFVTRSPYYTHAAFCSPCAPGACYLTSPTDTGGPKAYCFGHDFFEGGRAPYPVYEVSTGRLVEAAS